MSNGADEQAGEGGQDAEYVLAGATTVYCPYCGEPVQILIDAGGGAVQEYVEDCEVCCQPWSVRVSVGPDGGVAVSVETLDDA